MQQMATDIDTWIGDAIAAMPLSARQPSGALSALAQPVLKFATAVLKHRLHDAACIKLLRRFLAALLPAGESESEDDDGRQGWMHTESVSCLMINIVS